MGFVGHHLIEFSREALRGEQNASFYSALRKQQTKGTAPQSVEVTPLKKLA